MPEPLTPPLGFTWRDLVDHLVAERGSLTEVVRCLYELRSDLPDDPDTVTRGLRRLRHRTGAADKYGRLLLRTFGLPPAISTWAKALGTYHSPWMDLPLSWRKEQIRLWDRDPVLGSASGAWIHLACASVAHQDGDLHATDRRLALAALGASRAGAQVELELFLARREADDGRLDQALERLRAIDETDLSPPYRARWLDQQAYVVSRPWRSDPSALERAGELWRLIPAEGEAFVVFRRHCGLAWLHWRQDAHEKAVEHVAIAVSRAGDAGLRRLRAHALGLWSHIDPEHPDARRRRDAILRSIA